MDLFVFGMVAFCIFLPGALAALYLLGNRQHYPATAPISLADRRYMLRSALRGTAGVLGSQEKKVTLLRETIE